VASVRTTVGAYVALTKPRIIELLLVTTIPTMVLAADGWPGGWLMLWTLIGGALSAGGANAFNSYLDRDIDAIMKRTKKRPLVTGAVSERSALIFAWTLSVVSTAWFWFVVDSRLAAVLSVLAILGYVVGYTMILKRRTPQNIVWGGAAGCMPVLIGWAAVTDGLTWAPVVLFGVIFLWTPPHYWPLSMRYREDYDRAGVPMLSVVASPTSVAQKIVVYAWAMVACSVLLWPVAGTGLVYLGVAVVAGGAFVLEAHRLLARARANEPALAPMRLFHLSITYLSLLFLAVAADPFLHLAVPTPW